jgi:copper chaperone CopZ
MELPMSTFPALGKAQIFFHVKDMTSARSADAVRGALMDLDARATVRIDLALRRVEIDPDTGEAGAFRDAIRNAGYTSVRQWPSDQAYL